LIVQADIKARGRTDGAEVIRLAALPEPPPVRIVAPFGIPTETDLRIDAEVDGDIDQIGQFGPRGVNALHDDHISGWNDLRRCQPAIVGNPIVGLEGGRSPRPQRQQRFGSQPLPIDHGVHHRAVRHSFALRQSEPRQRVPVEVVAFQNRPLGSESERGRQDRLARAAWSINGDDNRPLRPWLAFDCQVQDR
jgi:hypothetical protein